MAAARPDPTMRQLKAQLWRRARALGLAPLGAAALDGKATRQRLADAERHLQAFLRAKRHGDMGWMARPERAHVARLLPQAASALVFGLNYAPPTDPMERLAHTQSGNISVYALGRDYHRVFKRRLKSLGRWLEAQGGGMVRHFVDTAPLMEKPLAAAAGLGWQGKHTNLVSRRYGSWLFLGCLLTELKLPPDEPHGDYCGSCRACLDVCPTNAFPAPYQLDARRCLSYLTIEHKAPIPRELRRALGNRIFGCDDCLAVCPWNKYARQARDAELAHRTELDLPPLTALAALDESGFRRLFAGTSIVRTGRERFVRNVLIALGNAAHNDTAQGDVMRAESEAAIVARLTDGAPLVRGAAVWALGQYLSAAAMGARARAAHKKEAEASVRAEWEVFL